MSGSKGFILLYRDIQDHWIYEEKRKFSRFEAWTDLLMMVNHKDAKIVQDGQLIEVKRGERITSIRQLMERWDWSNTKVVNFLNLLSKDDMITFEINDKKKTVIKILNYEQYQGFRASEQSEEKTQNNYRKDTEKTPSNINNNEEQRNNENLKDLKDIPPKRKKPVPDKKEYASEVIDLTNHLAEMMLLNNPKAKIPANMDRWNNEMKLLLKDYDFFTIRNVIDWCQNDSFWKSNILSVPKLREKFGTLLLQSQSRGRGGYQQQETTMDKLKRLAREAKERDEGGSNKADRDMFS